MYDSIVITLILFVDATTLWLHFLNHSRRAEQRRARKFKRLMAAVGL